MTYEEAQEWCNTQHHEDQYGEADVGFIEHVAGDQYRPSVGQEWVVDWVLLSPVQQSLVAIRFYGNESYDGWIDLRLEPNELE